mmetsp:Transcript_19452/g.48718  ORF Transcript_19452/g.48718 Transcript_19452/m.48718 type:complete len:361 (+) Transcript_19452:3062-4144(+)
MRGPDGVGQPRDSSHRGRARRSLVEHNPVVSDFARDLCRVFGVHAPAQLVVHRQHRCIRGRHREPHPAPRDPIQSVARVARAQRRDVLQLLQRVVARPPLEVVALPGRPLDPEVEAQRCVDLQVVVGQHLVGQAADEVDRGDFFHAVEDGVHVVHLPQVDNVDHIEPGNAGEIQERHGAIKRAELEVAGAGFRRNYVRPIVHVHDQLPLLGVGDLLLERQNSSLQLAAPQDLTVDVNPRHHDRGAVDGVQGQVALSRDEPPQRGEVLVGPLHVEDLLLGREPAALPAVVVLEVGGFEVRHLAAQLLLQQLLVLCREVLAGARNRQSPQPLLAGSRGAGVVHHDSPAGFLSTVSSCGYDAF